MDTDSCLLSVFRTPFRLLTDSPVSGVHAVPVRLKGAADPAGLFFAAAFFSVRPVPPIRNEGSVSESSFVAHVFFSVLALF